MPKLNKAYSYENQWENTKRNVEKKGERVCLKWWRGQSNDNICKLHQLLYSDYCFFTQVIIKQNKAKYYSPSSTKRFYVGLKIVYCMLVGVQYFRQCYFRYLYIKALKRRNNCASSFLCVNLNLPAHLRSIVDWQTSQHFTQLYLSRFDGFLGEEMCCLFCSNSIGLNVLFVRCAVGWGGGRVCDAGERGHSAALRREHPALATVPGGLFV